NDRGYRRLLGRWYLSRRNAAGAGMSKPKPKPILTGQPPVERTRKKVGEWIYVYNKAVRDYVLVQVTG
ncbi:MAG: hypothetical protein ABJ195_13705, partial [Marinomonas sp.]